MELQTAEHIYSKNVTEQELVNAFNDDGGRGEFIILSRNANAFIQAAGEFDGPYQLEYKDAEGHFKCLRSVTKNEVQAAFVSYLKDDIAWKHSFEWNEFIPKPWWKLW